MPRSLTWVDPAGEVTSLSALGAVFASRGVQIAGLPPVRASEIEVPLQPGGRWQQVSHRTRDVAVNIVVDGADVEAVFDTMDSLAVALDPVRGEGTLRVSRHDGSERDLHCRYVDGLGNIVEDTDRDPILRGVLMFRAVDPYWYDSVEHAFEFAPAGSPSTFFPFFPLVLGASESSTSGTVSNNGHVAAWPIWEIIGPGNLTATNVTTGESFDLDYLIDAGDTVTIDTRPGAKTVTSVADGDLFSYLTDSSSLWALATGDNEISLTMTSADEDSRVVMRWARRWLTA